MLYSSNPVVDKLQFSKIEIRALFHSWTVSVIPGSFHTSCVRLIKCSSSVTNIYGMLLNVTSISFEITSLLYVSLNLRQNMNRTFFLIPQIYSDLYFKKHLMSWCWAIPWYDNQSSIQKNSFHGTQKFLSVLKMILKWLWKGRNLSPQ
jgi:hypothetical protein